MIEIKNKVLLWDGYFIDEKNTTAQRVVHRPQKKERVMVFDKPWEGDGCDFYHIVKTEGAYRMYYNGRSLVKQSSVTDAVKICVIESKDGKSWSRPVIGKIDYNGCKENNIIKDSSEFNLDNFYIFYDENPDCPSDSRYKAVAMVIDEEVELVCYISADGITFTKSHSIFGKIPFKTEQCRQDVLFFDTLNIVFWDKEYKKYRMFVRGFHDIPKSQLPPGNDFDRNLGVRDIRYSESLDFINWTTPVRLNYNTAEYPLYTNAAVKYASEPDMFIAFPTRYNEYPDWNDSFEELCGKDIRAKKMERFGRRLGLAITDCVFMISRDAKNWTKFDEAYFTPGAEGDAQWTYGSCYPCAGLIFTAPDDSTYDDEISMFMPFNMLSGEDVELYRFTIRQDGFISYYGDFAEKKLISNEFLIKNADFLFVNFSSSAAGYIQIKIICSDGEVFCSQRHFGDKVNRLVKFDKPLSKLSGRTAKMEITLKDAHIYSVCFK